eukprot:838437-Amphidinium_carterae.2
MILHRGSMQFANSACTAMQRGFKDTHEVHPAPIELISGANHVEHRVRNSLFITGSCSISSAYNAQTEIPLVGLR